MPYNANQTLWRVINDFDMIARVPFTPCTLFNGGTGDENHLIMTKRVIKVFTSYLSNVVTSSINQCWITVLSELESGSRQTLGFILEAILQILSFLFILPHRPWFVWR
jgi:hypothetical protein